MKHLSKTNSAGVLLASLLFAGCAGAPEHVAAPTPASAPPTDVATALTFDPAAMLTVGTGVTHTSGEALDACVFASNKLIAGKLFRVNWFNRFPGRAELAQGSSVGRTMETAPGVGVHELLQPDGTFKRVGKGTYKNGASTSYALKPDGSEEKVASSIVSSCTKHSLGGYRVVSTRTGPPPVGTDKRPWIMKSIGDKAAGSYRSIRIGKPVDEPDTPWQWISAVVAVPADIPPK